MIVAPSISPDGRAYKWDDPDGEIAKPPPWLLSIINGPPRAVRSLSHRLLLLRGNGGRLRRLSTTSTPTPRDSWLEIGMTLHDRSPGAEGFDIWTAWSAPSVKFDTNDQRRTWESFKSGRPDGARVTLRTSFHRARDARSPIPGVSQVQISLVPISIAVNRMTKWRMSNY